MALDHVEQIAKDGAVGGWTTAFGGMEVRSVAVESPTAKSLALDLMDATAEVQRLRGEKDGAYSERDALVAALSKLFPASLERHPAEEEWDDDWRWIVFIELPTGQVTWHIHDSEIGWFWHLPRETGRKWDGHLTPEKYERLAALTPPAADTEDKSNG